MYRKPARAIALSLTIGFATLVGSWTIGERTGSAAESKLRFNRDVRPILSDKCFACHGPD